MPDKICPLCHAKERKNTLGEYECKSPGCELNPRWSSENEVDEGIWDNAVVLGQDADDEDDDDLFDPEVLTPV